MYSLKLNKEPEPARLQARVLGAGDENINRQSRRKSDVQGFCGLRQAETVFENKTLLRCWVYKAAVSQSLQGQVESLTM